MKITIDNYQDFAADWIDGTLAGDMLSEFEKFLAANPDIRSELKELREMEHFPASSDNPQIDFSVLKRSINDKTVNADNFLEFVMARIDGELDSNSIASLEKFLNHNPKHKREAALFDLCKLSPEEEITFPCKELLLQTIGLGSSGITAGNIEELIVASLEGELGDDDQTKLDSHLEANSDAMLLYRQYSLTLLKPDLSVKYPDKAQLKQKVLVPLYSRSTILRFVGVAASVAFIAGIFLFDRNNELLITTPGDQFLASTSIPELSDPVITAVSDDQQSATAARVKVSGKGKRDRALREETSVPEVIFTEDPGFTVEKYASRNADKIASTTSQAKLRSHISNHDNNIASISPEGPADRGRLTISEFPIEQIRYFTGGGNERPGLLADITLSRIVEVTNPHERINSAGQQIFSRWAQWRERALDEVIPYR